MSDLWTVLIVDDCAEDRTIYRRYLTQALYQSYQILEAASAIEGLTVCENMHCDVILLDFCLPDMNGLEFLNQLKWRKLDAGVPVIMLTGYGDQSLFTEALERGVRDYLNKKNLRADVLQLAIHNAIEKSHLKRELRQTQDRQRLIATTALRIRQSLNLEQILHTAVTEVQQLLECDRVVVYQFMTDRQTKTLGKSIESFRDNSEHLLQDTCWWQKVGRDYTWECQLPVTKVSEAGLSNCCLNLREQLTTFLSKFERSSRKSKDIVNIREQLKTFAGKQTQTANSLIVPIILTKDAEENSQAWGLLIAHHCSQKRQWHPGDEKILEELSVQLAIAIQQAELLIQTQAALEKEKQLNAFKSQIVATVSHEYRTPLTAILGAASTLKQNFHKLDRSRQERLLQIIEDKARQMTKLVEDMLIVHQCDLSQMTSKPVPLDLFQLFSDLIDEHSLSASAKHQLILNVKGNIEGFWGDLGLLKIIFGSLISNAIQYSPSGGNIEINLTGKTTQVIFGIKDEGIGIPIADRDNLFQSFSRGSNVDTIPGTGLGLAIAKACVELHGGEIDLSSKVGQGTKVMVSLPKRLKDGKEV